jgi:hypothetical protein
MKNKKVSFCVLHSMTIFFLFAFLSMSNAQVSLTVGYGTGYPGSSGRRVAINLDNQSDVVGGVQIDICDVDDYLTATACNTTERTPDFICQSYEQKNGCVGVVVYSPTCSVISEGTGPIVTLSYDVSEDAPPGECRDLNPGNEVILDGLGSELPSAVNPGNFCFIGCGDICPPDDPATPEWDCGDGVVDIYDLMCQVEFVMTATTPDECQVQRIDLPTGTPGVFGSCPGEDVGGCCPPDGMVDILDVMVIIDIAQGRPDCCNYFYTENAF